MPLKPHWFHILVALGERERHGSDIVRAVLDQTDGAVRLWPVMLYSSLERMADEGLIEELAPIGEHPAGESERRRYYRITSHGRTIARAEAERLSRIATLARAKLSPRRRDL